MERVREKEEGRKDGRDDRELEREGSKINEGGMND